jgi:hypothetical protein
VVERQRLLRVVRLDDLRDLDDVDADQALQGQDRRQVVRRELEQEQPHLRVRGQVRLERRHYQRREVVRVRERVVVRLVGERQLGERLHCVGQEIPGGGGRGGVRPGQ